MNRALLHQLQQMRSYPSITILFNTQPGSAFGPDENSATCWLRTGADGSR